MVINSDISGEPHPEQARWQKEAVMSEVRVAGGRGAALWPKDALRIAFGIIWAIDATLKWLPGFRASYMDSIMGIRDGQPGWLKPWFTFWINLQHSDAMFFAYLVAVIETLIAVAFIAGFARKYTYFAAAVFSVLIWATAEGFGGPYTSGASDIGTGVIYAVVFAGLLALSAYAGPALYSADYYMERRYSWWWHLAEVRRPVAASAPAPATALPAAGPPSATHRHAA
jgi:thiosulfate dehydrogenase (quinone) large subunit